MKSRRKRDIKILAVLLLSFVGIGYAALNANLKIDGVVNMPTASWDVHFANVQISSGSVALSTGDTAATIVTGQTNKVSYKVSFHNPGDYYEFTVDAVNNGTVDAMIDTISSKLNNTEITGSNLPAYLNYSVTYADGIELATKHKLEAGHTEKYKVRVEYKSDIEANELPQGETLNLNFQVDYVQADSTAIDKPIVSLPAGRTKDNLQVGDEICVHGTTTECFNFIGYDGNNIKMLSKWNLKVGNIYNSFGTKTGEYSSTDAGYGLQSSEARGLVSGTSTFNGTVAFSETSYWFDGSSLKSKYGLSYPADVYDTDYGDASGTNYSVAYYVENYKDTLETYGLTVQSARLLTYSEATDASIGCDSDSCPTSGFITNTSFWLGSAYGSDSVWFVYSFGDFNYYDSYDSDSVIGVRPVVVISKSDI